MERKVFETQQIYSKAKLAVDKLFTNQKYLKLKCKTNIKNIISAQKFVQSIPYIYNEWISGAPGMNYTIFMALQDQVAHAFSLYDVRNLIKNGDFHQGLQYWHAKNGVDIQKINDGNVLVISNWITIVSQKLYLQNKHGYVLRVTAKKEGSGNGYIKISDCANNIEILSFVSSNYSPNEELYDSNEYLTKTVEFSPDTDNIKIEIGEDEGVFKIESVELICIKN